MTFIDYEIQQTQCLFCKSVVPKIHCCGGINQNNLTEVLGRATKVGYGYCSFHDTIYRGGGGFHCIEMENGVPKPKSESKTPFMLTNASSVLLGLLSDDKELFKCNDVPIEERIKDKMTSLKEEIIDLRLENRRKDRILMIKQARITELEGMLASLMIANEEIRKDCANE